MQSTGLGLGGLLYSACIYRAQHGGLGGLLYSACIQSTGWRVRRPSILYMYTEHRMGVRRPSILCMYIQSTGWRVRRPSILYMYTEHRMEG